FSKSAGRFVSSSYYMDAYPDWVTAWNEAGHVARYGNTTWKLLDQLETYRFGSADDAEWETDFPGWGRVFPHPYGAADAKYYTTLLTLSPAGDELTADFAKALIKAEELGADDKADYLAVSFSSTDYVGHIFGPSSLESEDNLRRLDRTLAEFLGFIDETVGLDRTLIVLSADHGAPEVPGYLKSLGIEAGNFNFEDVDKRPAIEALKAKFGVAEELVASFSQPYVYLDDEVISAGNLDRTLVARELAKEIRKMPGIAYAISSEDLRGGSVAQTPVSDAVLANFHPDRSGDIYVVFQPQWFVADFDGLTVASSHGTPWTYDSYVPIIFVGPNISPATVHRRVETVDVAPTISAYLGIKPPSGSRGRVLGEVLR
ncbi:MAG: alkaline phosphatase family protein, partial [Anderseniella sp.]|nr:alkaline phosphatase family protein [Anderseniella sp.]